MTPEEAVRTTFPKGYRAQALAAVKAYKSWRPDPLPSALLFARDPWPPISNLVFPDFDMFVPYTIIPVVTGGTPAFEVWADNDVIAVVNAQSADCSERLRPFGPAAADASVLAYLRGVADSLPLQSRGEEAVLDCPGECVNNSPSPTSGDWQYDGHGRIIGLTIMGAWEVEADAEGRAMKARRIGEPIWLGKLGFPEWVRDETWEQGLNKTEWREPATLEEYEAELKRAANALADEILERRGGLEPTSPTPYPEEIQRTLDHYASLHDSDSSYEEFQFKIKAYISIPEEILAEFGNQAYEILSEGMNSELEFFMEDAEGRFPWIHKWRTEGRSGGWLILSADDAVIAGGVGTLDSVRRAKLLADDLVIIDGLVKEGVKGVEEHWSTLEPWPEIHGKA